MYLYLEEILPMGGFDLIGSVMIALIKFHGVLRFDIASYLADVAGFVEISPDEMVNKTRLW